MINKKYKVAIFDLDGTLLDTLDDLAEGVNFALQKYGLPVRTREEVRAFVGNGMNKLMERAIGVENIDKVDTEEVLWAFKRYYKENCTRYTKPYDGIIELLQTLKKGGIKTAVVSNKADFAVKMLVKGYFGDLILQAVGENEGAGLRRKPAPDTLLSVMQTLNATPSETVYIGDSEVDILTAKNAGVDCISVDWGFKDRAFLEENGGEIILSNPMDISSYLRKIGDTPIAEFSLDNGVKIVAKLENENLGGSIKDRVGQGIIDDAERNGKLKKGGTIVEATSGNTGIGLALVGSARDYKTVIVMPETMSEERRKMLADYGAELVLTDGEKGMQGAVEKAQEIVKNTPNSILADQFNNPVCAKVHYEKTAPELYAQADGKIDIFVAGVGTGGTLTGIGKYLKEKNPCCKVVAVEPKSSPLLSEGRAGAHGIQGIGANFLPSILDRNIYDEVFTVSDRDAVETAKKLNKEYGYFVGISSGANAYACLELAKREENAGKVIATVFPDDGNRYLSIFEK